MDYRYEFLNKYVGESFFIHKIGRTMFNGINQYEIVSNKGKSVLYIWVRDETYKLFRSYELCHMVSAFFGIGSEESMKLVKDWFGDKLNLKKVSDLLEIIMHKEEDEDEEWL